MRLVVVRRPAERGGVVVRFADLWVGAELDEELDDREVAAPRCLVHRRTAASARSDMAEYEGLLSLQPC